MKKSKFNLFNFTSKDNYSRNFRKYLTGIYHSNGYKYVTDSHILLKVKESYPENYEGRVILKSGELLPENTKLPNYDYVIRDVITHCNNCESIEIDFDKIEKMYKESKSLKKGKLPQTFIKINDSYFEFDLFNLLIRVMCEYNINRLFIHKNKRYAFVKNDICECILISSRIDEDYIDDDYQKLFKYE